MALALLALAPLRDAVRQVIWASGFQIHHVERYWADAVPWIDEPGRARTIAVTSGPEQNLDNWFVLPFAGRRLQNRVVYVTPTRDGSIAHFGRPDVERAFAESFDGHAWLGRLRARGVTEVMSFRPRSLEQAWMEERPALFRKLAGGPDFGLFELVPARAGAALSSRR